ncbi:MAG: hypothetical protein U1C33_03465, partial [Candidatus Cloacimonadaceae bacterium]|nr:hypothetical protein [Candidatus Cloacimonadaceae bacterium]
MKSASTALTTKKYNPQGYLECVTYGDKDSFNSETVYTYDSRNKVLTSVSQNPYHEENYRITNTYGADGLLVKTLRKSPVSYETDIAEYNDKKQLCWMKSYYADKSLIDAVEYFYDSAGNKIRENYFDENMELSSQLSYIYDKDNKLIEKQDYKGSFFGDIENICKYNAQGLLTEEILFVDDELEESTTYSYDQYGNLTLQVVKSVYQAAAQTYTNKYTYDKQNNWVSMESALDGVVTEKEE